MQWEEGSFSFKHNDMTQSHKARTLPAPAIDERIKGEAGGSHRRVTIAIDKMSPTPSENRPLSTGTARRRQTCV